LKQDLDRLMDQRGLSALMISGTARGNPAMAYMVNDACISGGYVVKKMGQDPVLFCLPIERECAAVSGLEVINLARYNPARILRESADELSAAVELHRRIFAELEVTGPVGFYGNADQGRAWLLLAALKERLTSIEVCAEFGPSVLDMARATKDSLEVARIKDVAERTSAVVERTIRFLREHRVVNGVLVQGDGAALTIGHVHKAIDRFMAELRLEDPERFIFSIGRDAAIPHSRGNFEDRIELGRSIVFDIFPRDAGGGYFFDLTRTFCLGYAPLEVERAYQDVLECVQMLTSVYAVGVETKHYQQMACSFFEQRGHPTVGSDPRTEDGYVHGLGHGIGLEIHEEPSFRDAPMNDGVLLPGHIFTCEPGLYYPDRGFGVRIEDVIWLDGAGEKHNLTSPPYELVIEV